MRKLGFEFYSNYLGSKCKVAFYLSDNHWWFKSEKHDRIMKAATPLSFFIKQEEEKNSK